MILSLPVGAKQQFVISVEISARHERCTHGAMRFGAQLLIPQTFHHFLPVEIRLSRVFLCNCVDVTRSEERRKGL